MSGTTWTADGGRIAAELRNWAQGCHSTEAAVELLIRARGGRFVDPSQPWLRTDDRGIVWLDAQVIRQYSHAVSSGERHILALVEALALGGPLEDVGGLMASLDPYHLGLVLAVLRHAGSGSESTRNSTVPRPEGIGRSSEGVVLIALGPMRATRTGIDSRSVGAPVAVSTDRK